MPIGYLNFGGYAATGGITRYTRLGDAGLLRNIASPARSRGDPNARYLSTADWAAVRSLQTDDAERLSQTSNLLAGDAKSRRLYAAAFGSAEGLRGYADAIPPAAEREQAEIFYAPSGVTYRSELRRQAQLSVLAFKTGVAVSADLWLGGFDTHAVHDPDHEWLLGNLTDGIDYLWDYAEEHGVADRMVVVVGSDFARTNHYNSQQGKDHWPIGSYVIMEKNQPWTNRSVGVTDELHFAHPVNPETLARDDARGTRVYPKHVHKALRRHLGIEASEAAALFAFPNTEDFAFFGSS